jgi:hypothetical protein
VNLGTARDSRLARPGKANRSVSHVLLSAPVPGGRPCCPADKEARGKRSHCRHPLPLFVRPLVLGIGDPWTLHRPSGGGKDAVAFALSSGKPLRSLR